jgi:hypothetical protein
MVLKVFKKIKKVSSKAFLILRNSKAYRKTPLKLPWASTRSPPGQSNRLIQIGYS